MTELKIPRPDRFAAAQGFFDAAGRLVARQAQAEWFGSPFHLLSLRRPKTTGVAAAPRNPRPVRAARGEAILAGNFTFAGQTLRVGVGGDPWDKPSPSRLFAEALHGADWLGDLLALGEPGEREALRLLLDWRRIFGGWNSFSWSAEVLERRTLNLAGALKRIAARASDVEALQLTETLARQGRHLLKIRLGPARAAERACAAAAAGTALAGEAGETLMTKALARLALALSATVLPDGGHASRSPEAGLELLLDLVALDDGLSQRGRTVPDEMGRAMDRLAAALRLFILPDGKLACFQGGEAGDPAEITAARSTQDLADGPPPAALAKTGYQRLMGRSLTVIADAGAPAAGAWSETALAQPLAIEVVAGGDRLITNCGWSPRAAGPQALRLTAAGSTVSVGDGSTAEPAAGRLSGLLGIRLKGGPKVVTAKRQDTLQGGWLEMAHDGWVDSWGLRHQRMLFVDRNADEMRGEDRLSPAGPGGGPGRVASVAVRFHLHPTVRASLARDGRSVLIQSPNTKGWWLRNDAADVSIEPSVFYEDGLPKRSSQIVLRLQAPTATGGRVRWKLAAVEPGAEG